MKLALTIAIVCGAVLAWIATRNEPTDWCLPARSVVEPVVEQRPVLELPPSEQFEEILQEWVEETSIEDEVATVLAAISQAEASAPQRSPRSFLNSNPPELQFGCAVHVDSVEEALAARLADGAPVEQVGAVRLLWRGQSRLSARRVLDFISSGQPTDERYVNLQREVEANLTPESVLREMRSGQYAWGAWLAYMRPHERLVPELLAALDKQTDFRPETLLALGKSGDRRTLVPLVGFLHGRDYVDSGFAAHALGDLGDPAGEPQLITSLASDKPWVQVNACGALRKIGSRRALPELERLANDKGYTGVFGVARIARETIEAILQREKQ